jgi:cell division protein FtsL
MLARSTMTWRQAIFKNRIRYIGRFEKAYHLTIAGTLAIMKVYFKATNARMIY